MVLKKVLLWAALIGQLQSTAAFGASKLPTSLRSTHALQSVCFRCSPPLTVRINSFGSGYGSEKVSPTQLSSSIAADPAPEARKPPSSVKSIAKKTVKKLLPLGLMLFFILFNYTILRDTKDVLVVTAPNSGAEIIPFLKTYVNLPSAIGFTLLYSALCNKMSPDKVFYVVMTAFLTFFGAFAGIICKLLFGLITTIAFLANTACAYTDAFYV